MEEAERVRRRLEEKWKSVANERTMAETLQKNLENEILRLKQWERENWGENEKVELQRVGKGHCGSEEKGARGGG